MIKVILIAMAAGFASALMAATIASGAGLAMPLVLLAPLPLLIAAFGWHPLVAALGGAITCAMLAMFARGSVAVIFATLVAFPAWAFGSIVWNSTDQVRSGILTGRLMMAACLLGALATLLGALSISFSYDELEMQLMRQAEATLRFMMRVPADQPLPQTSGNEAEIIIRAYATAVPAVTTGVLGFIYVLNIYLAGRIARQSGRLPIEWPDVASVAAPRQLLLATAVLMLLMLLPGYLGLIAELLATAGLMALSMIGFATTHFVSRGWGGRVFLLSVLWFATIIFGLPAMIMLFVGIVELTFGLRARKSAGAAGPPRNS